MGGMVSSRRRAVSNTPALPAASSASASGSAGARGAPAGPADALRPEAEAPQTPEGKRAAIHGQLMRSASLIAGVSAEAEAEAQSGAYIDAVNTQGKPSFGTPGKTASRRELMMEKARILADVQVDSVKEFRKLMGASAWTGKRGDALLVLVEDRASKDVKAAIARLDLAARGLQDCPRLQGYIRLQSLDLSHNLFQRVHRSVWTLKHIRRLDLRRTGLLEVPKALSRLIRLQHLDLGENSVHTLPLTMSRFAGHMHTLKLDSNPMLFPPLSVCTPTGDDKADAYRVLAFLRNHSRMLAGLNGGENTMRKHGKQALQLRVLLFGADESTSTRTHLYHTLMENREALATIARRNVDLAAVAESGMPHVPLLSLGTSDVGSGPSWKVRSHNESIQHVRSVIERANYIGGGCVDLLTIMYGVNHLKEDGGVAAADAHKIQVALYDMAFDVASMVANPHSTLFMLVWDAVRPTQEASDAMAVISGDLAVSEGRESFTAQEFDKAKKVVDDEYKHWTTILHDRVSKPLAFMLEAYPEGSVLLVMNCTGDIDRTDWIKWQSSKAAMLAQTVVARVKSAMAEVERSFVKYVTQHAANEMAVEGEKPAADVVEALPTSSGDDAVFDQPLPHADGSAPSSAVPVALDAEIIDHILQKMRFTGSLLSKYNKAGARHALTNVGIRTLAFRGYSARVDADQGFGIDVLRDKIGEVVMSLLRGLTVNPGIVYRSQNVPAPLPGTVRYAKLPKTLLVGLDTTSTTAREVREWRDARDTLLPEEVRETIAAEESAKIVPRGIMPRNILDRDAMYYGGAITADMSEAKYKGSIHGLVACKGCIVACSSHGTSTVWTPTFGGRVANNNYGWSATKELVQHVSETANNSTSVIAACCITTVVSDGSDGVVSEERLVTLGSGGDLLVWNPDESWSLERSTTVRSPLSACDWDGFVAVGCEDGHIRVFDINPKENEDDMLDMDANQTNKVRRIANMKAHVGGVQCLATSVPGCCGTDANGLDSVLFSGGTGGRVRMWMRVRSMASYQSAARTISAQDEALKVDGDADPLAVLEDDTHLTDADEVPMYACIGVVPGFTHGVRQMFIDSTGLACSPNSVVAADGDGVIRVLAYCGAPFRDWVLDHITECKANNRDTGSFGATKADSVQYAAAAQHIKNGDETFGVQRMFDKSWRVMSTLQESRHGTVTAMEPVGGYLATAGLDMSIRMWVLPRKCVSLDVASNLRLDGLPRLGRTHREMTQSWHLVRVIRMKQPVFAFAGDSSVLLAGTGGPHGGAAVQVFSGTRPMAYVPPSQRDRDAIQQALIDRRTRNRWRCRALIEGGVIVDADKYPFARRHSVSDLTKVPRMTSELLTQAKAVSATQPDGKATFDEMLDHGRKSAEAIRALNRLATLSAHTKTIDEDPMKRFRRNVVGFKDAARKIKSVIEMTRSSAAHRLALAAGDGARHANADEVRGRQQTRLDNRKAALDNELASSSRRRTASAPPALRVDLGFGVEGVDNAATKIQSRVRARRAQREFTVRKQYNVQFEAPARDAAQALAVIIIRARFLAFLERRRFLRERAAMVHVQARIRCYLMRKRFLRRLRDERKGKALLVGLGVPASGGLPSGAPAPAASRGA